MKEPILKLHKKAEPKTHKMIIPKDMIEKWGLEYFMEIYEDKIILKPIKKGE